MPLAYERYLKIENKVIDEIKKRLDRANRYDEIDIFLKSIGCEDAKIEYQTSYTKNAKILIFGDSQTNVDDLIREARNLGIGSKSLEFRMDYKKNKHFDFTLLKNNQTYSDVMFGPNAHKSMGIGNNSSAIEMFESHPELYPKKVEIRTYGGSLKISATSFRNALMETQFYKDLY